MSASQRPARPAPVRRPRPTGRPHGLRTRGRARRTHGLTLIEVVTALSILSMLLAGSWHALRELPARIALRQVASLLETDLKYARSMSLASDRTVRWQHYAATNGATCYVIYTGPRDACRCAATATNAAASTCSSDAELLRVAAQPASSPVQLGHSGRVLSFDPGKGTVTPTATIRVLAATGDAIHQVVNIMGRTRSCSPNRFGGLPRC